MIVMLCDPGGVVAFTSMVFLGVPSVSDVLTISLVGSQTSSVFLFESEISIGATSDSKQDREYSNNFSRK